MQEIWITVELSLPKVIKHSPYLPYQQSQDLNKQSIVVSVCSTESPVAVNFLNCCLAHIQASLSSFSGNIIYKAQLQKLVSLKKKQQQNNVLVS